MSSSDPQRLSALKNVPELTDALEAARERLPDASRLDALRARVEATSGASVQPKANAWPTALKIVVPLLGVAGALIGVQRLARHAEAPRPYVAPSASVSSLPPPASEPAPNSTLPLPPPRALPSAQLVARSSTVPGAVSALPAAVSAPSSGASAPSLAPTPPVSSELDLVKEAGQALKSDPSRALQLTMEHARIYPSGALAEEREVIAIEALAHLRRLSAARSRAERFIVAYPRSAHLSRVQHAAGLDAKIDAGDQNSATPSALDQQ